MSGGAGRAPSRPLPVPPARDGTSGERGLSRTATVGGVLLAVGSLGYVVAGVLVGGEPGRAGYLHPLNAPASASAAAGAALLAGVLARWRPPGVRAWVMWLSALGMASLASGAWLSATVLVGLASQAPSDEAFLASGTSWWALLFLAPKASLLVGLTVLVIRGGRRVLGSRVACVLLVLAGLLSLWPPFPPSGVLAGLGLVLVARRPVPG